MVAIAPAQAAAWSLLDARLEGLVASIVLASYVAHVEAHVARPWTHIGRGLRH